METLDDIKNSVEKLISAEESKLNVLKQIWLLLHSDELNAQGALSLVNSLTKP
ncbi:MAG: hypothetical protein ACLQQ4_08960 [Bacteroidia bacterium]